MRFLHLLLVCACAYSAVVLGEKLRFDNHRVYNLVIENDEQLETLQKLELNPDGLRFWESPVRTNMQISIVAPPTKVAEFEEIIEDLNLDAQVTIENLQALIDAEKRPKQGKADGINWTEYFTLDEIYAWLDELLAENPDVLSPLTGGQTYEGRQIRGVKLSYKQGNPGIFLDSNIHAREWITSATSTYILNQFLTSADPAIRNLAENYDWYIFPVINPDGFVYSHDVDRQWRKTRSRHSVLCYGADPNRNWGFNFMQGGASSIPCTDTFAGPSAFSEIEAKTLSEYYTSISSSITLYLSFHSYGQYLLMPYGDQRGARPTNYDDMMIIGNATRDTILSFENVLYDVGTAYDVLYTASGISMDWMMGTAETPLAFTFEFRDKGNFGFVLPPEQIIPNAREVLASIVTMVDKSVELGYFPEVGGTP